MERVRLGNDIEVHWAIYTGADAALSPYDLTGRDIAFYVKSAYGKVRIKDFIVDGNVIIWTFRGRHQRHTGAYSFELRENEGKDGMRTVDENDAFEIYDEPREICPCGNEDSGLIDSCKAFALVDATAQENSSDPTRGVEITALHFSTSWGAQYIEIIDNLDSDNANAALSARQGKVLLEKVTAVGTQLTKVEQQVIPQLTKVLDTLTGGVEVDGSVDNKIRRSVTIGSLD